MKKKTMDLMNEAEKLYKDLQNRYHGNYAAMYAFVSKCCGDIAEAEESEEKLLLYQKVRELISYSIITEYMNTRDYRYSEDKHEWIKI